MLNVIKPYKLILIINILFFLTWLLLPDKIYSLLAFDSEKYYSLKSILFYLLFYIVFSSVTFLFSIKANSRKQYIGACEINSLIIDYICVLLTVISFTAFAYYLFKLLVIYGQDVFSLMIQGNFIEIKYLSNKIGIPLLTQLCIPAGVLYAINCFILNKKHNIVLLFLIFFPGLIRGLFLSERLSLMEVMIPFLVIYLYNQKKIIKIRSVIYFIVIFILFFILAESFRSYYFFKGTDMASSKFSWGLLNFLDYLICPVNYAMYITNNINIHTFPINQLKFCTSYMQNFNFICERIDLYDFLHLDIRESAYGIIYYTNISLIGETFIDMGYCNLIYISCIGALIGLLYKHFINGGIIGQLSYPIIFLGILESYRINYFTEPRFVFPFLTNALVVYLIIVLYNFNIFKYYRRSNK